MALAAIDAGAASAVAGSDLFASYTRSFTKDEEEDAKNVRMALRGNPGDPPLSRERLGRVLKRAHDDLLLAHRGATETWGLPLSLFDTAAAEMALRRGVPCWAVQAVQEACELVGEAAHLGHCHEAYEEQFEAAFRSKTRIAAAPVLELLDQLHSLAQRVRAHLPLLQAAQGAFKAPKEAPASAPQLALLARAQIDQVSHGSRDSALFAGGASAAAPFSVASLQKDPSYILEPRSATDVLAEQARSLWKVVKTQGEDAWSSAQAKESRELMLGSLHTAKRGALKVAGAAVTAASAAGWGTAGYSAAASTAWRLTCSSWPRSAQAAAEPPPDEEAASPPQRRRWDQVRGRPAPWLAVEELQRDRRLAAAACGRLSSRASLGIGAQSRWERCRRSYDRRWTLA